MAETYADLNLYFGLVNSDGCGEGLFDVNKLDNEWALKRFNQAIETVKMYLQPSFNFGFRMGSDSLVSTREEADSLIDYAIVNICGAESIISLYDCIHGKIRFHQLLRFNGWTRAQERELITDIRESGFKPRFYMRDELEQQLKWQPENEYFKKQLLDAEEVKWGISLKWMR
ncbi:MAG TPA: hypothetical protein VI815_04300 [Candidatus Nanoarchaeia archaeon]|nr:hypothetical protein [Candidatus Nanoarchaeia archaeon]